MKVTVRFFAALRERIGSDLLELDVEEGSTLGGVIDRVVHDHPVVEGYVGRMMTAVNREYVRSETRLRAGDEIALFPPVSGG